MNVVLVLIPVTLLIVLVATALFFWAVNHQQFDDMDSPAVLPLIEDDAPMPPPDGASNTPLSTASDGAPRPSKHP
jgi:cbb3-type cytochrome oxidase maturation protein